MQIDPVLALAIALAGGVGSVLRLTLGRWQGRLPWGTLTANLVGALVLGLSMALTDASLLPHWLGAVLLVGFAGGLSTFSGVAAETGEFIRSKNWAKAAANLSGNLFLPVLMVWLPYAAVTLLVN